MAGGKGGTQTSTVTVPEWLETAAKGNLARADKVSEIGYTPYYGPDVAALTPTQVAAMQNNNAASNAFGLATADPLAGMPQAQTFAGGVQGYSSAPLYQEGLAQLQANAPGQYGAITSMFIDPLTGKPRQPTAGVPPAAGGPNKMGGAGDFGGSNFGGFGGQSASNGGMFGGYTGLGDMVNGGGPGASGPAFSGGPTSGLANMAGISPAGSGGSSGMGGGK